MTLSWVSFHSSFSSLQNKKVGPGDICVPFYLYSYDSDDSVTHWNVNKFIFVIDSLQQNLLSYSYLFIMDQIWWSLYKAGWFHGSSWITMWKVGRLFHNKVYPQWSWKDQSLADLEQIRSPNTSQNLLFLKFFILSVCSGYCPLR